MNSLECIIGPEKDKQVFKLIVPDIDNNEYIGIMLSGGLDSATLLMLLSKLIPSYRIQTFTVPRSDDALLHANRLIESLNLNFQMNFSNPIKVGDGQGFHGGQVVKGLREILYNLDNIKYLYLAENQPPERTEIVFDTEYPHRANSPNMHKKLIMPFWHLKKYHIIDIVVQFSWQHLFNITHSCCAWPKGRCAKCFNCLERDWAFKKLSYTDSGIL